MSIEIKAMTFELIDSITKDYLTPSQQGLIVAIRQAYKEEEQGMSGQWDPNPRSEENMKKAAEETTRIIGAPGIIQDREPDCLAKAKERGQITFTLVEQDYSSPHIICCWIAANIETCPKEKLFEALDKAIRMRDTKVKRKDPD